MNSLLLDISRKIEPQKAAVLAAVDRAAGELNIPFFVVGGAARDFIMQDGYDIRTPRVTHDIDIGISVSSWDEFSGLIERLLSVENFQRTDIEHKYKSPTQIEVDILPFGAIAGLGRKILWRQDNREMNMAGFDEAFSAAVTVTIASSPHLAVKIVSLAGLAFLKLLSWNDNPIERDRDAKDFKTIMDHYLDTQSIDDVYSVHHDIAESGDYDLISARVLGRDIQTISRPEVYSHLVEILNRECDLSGFLRFIRQMRTALIDEETTAKDIKMLNAVFSGVTD